MPSPSHSSFRLKYGQWAVALPSRGEFVVGREVDCDLRLNDSSVSRRHAFFKVESGIPYVRDNDSCNGVFAGGKRTRGWVALDVGQRVVIGAQAVQLLTDAPEADAGGSRLGLEEPPTDRRAQGSLNRTPPLGLAVALTARERQVLSMVARGYTQREVGVALGVQLKTIESHVRRVRDKTGSRDRGELIEYARETGVISEFPCADGGVSHE